MVRGGARGPAFVLFLLPSLLSARGGWDDPPGGWDYVYEADAGEDAFVDRGGAQTVKGLLDGSWIGGQETYFWDGSAPGEYDSADADGRVYRAETIAPGAEADLAPTPITPQGASLRNVYQSDWLRSLRHMEQEPQTYLRPGAYVAVLEENPFVETGLRGAVGGDCRTLVYGICAGDDDGRPR